MEKLRMGFTIVLDGDAYDVEVEGLRPHVSLRVDGRLYEVTADRAPQGRRDMVEIDGKSFRFTRAHIDERLILRSGGRTFDAKLVDPLDAAEAAGGEQDHVRAPMPGSVIQIHKHPGEEVKRGDTLVTIESMKLQIALVAPRE